MPDKELQWHRTHCARMDHGGCALQVAVENNRIIKIKGDPDGYLSQGYLCAKGLASPERLTHPERLRQPLQRAGERGAGKWRPISWQQALDEIAGRLKRVRAEHGAEAVAFGLGMPKGLDHFVLIRLANLFGSPNVVASQDVCHAPREISGVHTCGFYPVADFHHPSRLVLLWGSNLPATNEEGVICSRLFNQLRQGAELVVVDPRRIPLAERAREWLQLRPGSDAALALGLLNVIVQEELYDHEFVAHWTHGFEDLAKAVKAYPPEKVSQMTWVPADQIRRVARLYAAAKPAALQWGNPIEHHVNTFDTVRALICVMAVCGNLDVPGGNVKAREPAVMPLGRFVRADMLPDKHKRMLSAHYGVIPRFMTVPPAFFRRAVLESTPYAVKAFYGMCCNPMLSWADSRLTEKALRALSFLAVADLYMTPTAALADIVLPVASHFEFDDIGHYGLGHGIVLARPAVVEPPEGCLPDMQILNELGKRISPPELWHDDYHRFLDDVLAPSGLSYQEFAEKGFLKGPEAWGEWRESGFRTPTGKVELRLSRAEAFGLPALPAFRGLPEEEEEGFPLVLTSSKSRYFLHSSYRWVPRLRQKRPFPKAELHPVTAARYDIEDGKVIWIETPYGRISHVAHLTDRVHPRVVNAAHGWWFPEEAPGAQEGWQRSNFNMLTSVERLGKAFGTPNLKAIPCRVSPKEDNRL